MNAEIYLQCQNLKAEDESGNLIGEKGPIHFSLRSGEIGGILYARHALALFYLIMGKGSICNGQVRILGEELRDDKLSSDITWRQVIGFAGARKGLLSNLSLFDNINLPAKYHGHYLDDAGQVHLTETQLELLEIDRAFWNLRPSQVPGHIVKKVLLARSVVLNPKILLLDSPSEFFHWQEIPLLRRWILSHKEEGRAILIGSDNVPFLLSLCDGLMVYPQGQLDTNFKNNVDPQWVKIAQIMKETGDNNEILSN